MEKLLHSLDLHDAGRFNDVDIDFDVFWLCVTYLLVIFLKLLFLFKFIEYKKYVEFFIDLIFYIITTIYYFISKILRVFRTTLVPYNFCLKIEILKSGHLPKFFEAHIAFENPWYMQNLNSCLSMQTL